MKRSSNRDELVLRCQELEVTVALWAAANDAKAARIAELEALCSQLQQRVARLGRREGKRESSASVAQVRHAR